MLPLISINFKHFDICTIEYVGRRLGGVCTLLHSSNTDLSPPSWKTNVPAVPFRKSSLSNLLIYSLQINCLLSSLNGVCDLCSAKQLSLLLQRLLFIEGSSESGFSSSEITKENIFCRSDIINICDRAQNELLFVMLCYQNLLISV